MDQKSPPSDKRYRVLQPKATLYPQQQHSSYLVFIPEFVQYLYMFTIKTLFEPIMSLGIASLRGLVWVLANSLLVRYWYYRGD